MDWNDFNREMQNRISDPGTRYCLGLIYERLLDIAKQTDMSGKIMLEFANTMNNFMNLNEQMDSQMKTLRNHIIGREGGVFVESQPITNDDE